MMAHSVRFWTETQRYWVRFSDESGVCHRGCVYIVFQKVQMLGVCNAVYGSVRYTDNLSVGLLHSPYFGLPIFLLMAALGSSQEMGLFFRQSLVRCLYGSL